VLTVGGTTTVNSPGLPINIQGGSNSLTGAVSLTGTNATIDSLATGFVFGASTLTGNLSLNSNNQNVSQTSPITINGTTNINSGTGFIALGNASNDFVGGVTATSSNTGTAPITFADANTFTPTSITTTGTGTGTIALSANTLAGGTLGSTSGTANLTSNTNVTSLVLNFPNVTKNNKVFLLGSATQWTLTGTIPATGDSFGAASGVGVTINGTNVQAGSLQRQTELVISAAQASATSAAAKEAANTFGTDSVAQQIEYGFAGDVGVLPPIDHRLQGVGISVPKCFNESREGEAC
jgi:hypothetical protein